MMIGTYSMRWQNYKDLNSVQQCENILMVQRQSEGLKKGSGPTHDKAVENVVCFIKSQGEFDIYTEWVEFFSQKFIKQNMWKKEPSHSYDIVCQRTANYIPYGNRYYIEVDGEKHMHKEPQINDGIAEKYVTEELKGIIIRLRKDECLGDKEDRENYFRTKLGELFV